MKFLLQRWDSWIVVQLAAEDIHIIADDDVAGMEGVYNLANKYLGTQDMVQGSRWYAAWEEGGEDCGVHPERGRVAEVEGYHDGSMDIPLVHAEVILLSVNWMKIRERLFQP